MSVLEEITEDLHNHSIEFVLSKYNLKWKDLVRIQYENHTLNDSGLPLYIHNSKNNKYMIMKNNIYYGLYSSLDEAIEMREKLILNNWKKIINKKK